MNDADIVLSILTCALVITTVVYASFTYKMMRTADRTEQSLRKPTLGLLAESATPLPMEPQLEPVLTLYVKLTNLGAAPLLQIAVDASLWVENLDDSKLLFPRPIVPFLAPGETTYVVISFISPFDQVFAVAQLGRRDFSISSDTEEGSYIDFGQKFPVVRIAAAFRNQAEDRGTSETEVQLLPVGTLEDEHSFMVVAVSPEKSLRCQWIEPAKRSSVLLRLKGWTKST